MAHVQDIFSLIPLWTNYSGHHCRQRGIQSGSAKNLQFTAASSIRTSPGDRQFKSYFPGNADAELQICKYWHKPMKSLPAPTQRSWHNWNIWLWQWNTYRRNSRLVCLLQQTQQIRRVIITVVFSVAIILMGVKPAWTRNRSIRENPTTRSNWSESKRGVNNR